MNAKKGYDKKLKHEWEIGRMIAFYSISPYTKKIKKPSDLFSLESQEKPKQKNQQKKAKFKRIDNGDSKS